MYGRMKHLRGCISDIYISVQRNYYYGISQVYFYGENWKNKLKNFSRYLTLYFWNNNNNFTILKCEVILFRNVERYEQQTLYPGSRLIPLRNEPILQIWVTGNIFKDISSKSSKRIMQYHEHWRSRETERKNNHSK